MLFPAQDLERWSNSFVVYVARVVCLGRCFVGVSFLGTADSRDLVTVDPASYGSAVSTAVF